MGVVGARVVGFGELAAVAVEAEFVVEGLEADLEEFGGAGLVVVSLLEGAEDHLAFHLFDRRADGKRDGVFDACAGALVERVGRDVVALD